MERLEKLSLEFESLAIFRGLLTNETLTRLSQLLSSGDKRVKEQVACYAGFVNSLYQNGENLTDFIWKLILADENVYVLKRAQGEPVSAVLAECLTHELAILQEISQLRSEEVKSRMPYEGFLPGWSNRRLEFQREYESRMERIATGGYGVFSEYLMFSFQDGQIVPVQSPDPVRLASLSGYEMERKRVTDNTLALLDGKPAANALLYGDAGTGKSSTVKALVNEYGKCGLRLIEVRKGQLLDIPKIVEMLSRNPLKFILFIDDLSFTQSNEEIGALKAILEGSVSAKTSNVVIYATSNRRHLVKETFSERGDDDIHRNETIQEQVSLSERFGLSVYFGKPDKNQYLAIVSSLAQQYGIKDTENLALLAERHATERGGRSPRTARQFVEYLKSVEK